MREALLAVDPEEAEHFKVTKEAFQRVDIKKKYGVKRLREVVERNLEGDRASPMRSTPSWVHELVLTKHEGVAKIHLERVERKETWTAHRVGSSQSRGCLGVDEASNRFWGVSADSCSELKKSKTELSWSDWKDQVPLTESEVLPAAVADRQDESSSSSYTSSSSSTESNTWKVETDLSSCIFVIVISTHSMFGSVSHGHVREGSTSMLHSEGSDVRIVAFLADSGVTTEYQSFPLHDRWQYKA